MVTHDCNLTGECSVCDKTSGRTGDACNHADRYHTSVNKKVASSYAHDNMCTACDKDNALNYQLNRHMKARHSPCLVQIDGNISLSSSTESLDLDSVDSSFLPFSDLEPSYDEIFSQETFSLMASSESTSLGPNSASPADVTSTPVAVTPPPLASNVPTRKKDETARSLPNIMVTNHRSIFPKFNNLIDELIECEMHLGIHSEIWENKENVNHQNKIEEALEIHGIHYISNPRPKRRGGGAAITLCDMNGKFTLTKLSVSVPPDLEVCWGLLKVKGNSGSIREIIVCAFYCPPRSKKKTKLVEHISVEYFKQKAAHPRSAFICGGDKNDLNIKHLLDISPCFRQIVTRPTHKNSVLEIIVTDIGHFYNEPVIRPPIQPDIEGEGVPSDHSIAYATPITDSSKPSKRSCLTKISRPLTTVAKQKLEL